MNVTVVIPARNEEELIGHCLSSVSRASRFVKARIIVVADNCSDRTVPIARAFTGVEVIEANVANVGLARGIGVEAATSDWIATTDADSSVPPNWLTVQLQLAERGVDAVVGTVRPASADLTPDQWAVWQRSHENGRALGHVHGANLGFRASSYRAVGGFAPLVEHEDIDLVHRLRSGGFHISASDQCEVVTSGRRVGRTPGGYARYLRDQLFAGQPDPV